MIRGAGGSDWLKSNEISWIKTIKARVSGVRKSRFLLGFWLIFEFEKFWQNEIFWSNSKINFYKKTWKIKNLLFFSLTKSQLYCIEQNLSFQNDVKYIKMIKRGFSSDSSLMVLSHRLPIHRIKSIDWLYWRCIPHEICGCSSKVWFFPCRLSCFCCKFRIYGKIMPPFQ